MVSVNAALVGQGALNSYCFTAVSVVVIHEYVATFAAEVELIWRQKLANTTAIIFLLNRYNTLAMAAFYLANTCLTFPSQTSCKVVQSLELTSNLVSLGVWAAFAALRVYTLNSGNIHLALAALGLGLVPVVTNLYLISEQLSSKMFFEKNVCVSELDSVGTTWNTFVLFTMS
ncbi:hypothetical protein OBBRIDRAFT_808270 [Obba rivulosa]|uniref:DUF6533 domain-containing protein n=1 Tax=Obba rivulosa TaxID=1052685 RepID=A0A8E2AHR2_9APHY|nr:hypothetical protein OBBRIDRAFT_808270 [Obba rivulosa]